MIDKVRSQDIGLTINWINQIEEFSPMTKEQAAHTAASALEQIAINSRRTVTACIVTAVASVLVALVVLSAAYQYWRVTTAMNQLSAALDRNVEHADLVTDCTVVIPSIR